MSGNATFKWRPGAQDALKACVASGMLNALYYAKDRAMNDAPVRGGHRSFLTGSHLGGPLNISDKPGTKRAKPTVGGTLRRSIFVSVSINGSSIPGSDTKDGNGNQVDGLSTGGADIVGTLGTNAGYGGWVDGGTARMPARPFIFPAIQLMGASLASLFVAGFNKAAARFK